MPVGASAVNAAKTACGNGHPFDEVNTHIRPDGRRQCRRCHRERDRERKAEFREANLRLVRVDRKGTDELSHVRIPVEPLTHYFAVKGISIRQRFHPNVVRQYDRAKSLGYISLGYADDIAGLLKVHPYEIWGLAWFGYGPEEVSA